MAGINKVILVGNLGKDPEVMTFDSGNKKAAFSLATTESYRDKEGQWQDQTEWHNVVAWGYLAEKNLVKGDQIYLEGKIRTRSYDDKDGNKRYITEINAVQILKLNRTGSAPGQSDAPAPQAAQSTNTVTDQPDIEAPDDDLPF